jgi:hypothetical protein
VALHVPAVHLHDSGKEDRKKRNEEYDESENVPVGEVAHKWQPCSTGANTVVK